MRVRSGVLAARLGIRHERVAGLRNVGLLWSPRVRVDASHETGRFHQVAGLVIMPPEPSGIVAGNFFSSPRSRSGDLRGPRSRVVLPGVF